MPDTCQQIFEQVAGRFAVLPAEYRDLGIRGNIPDFADWIDLNCAFCSALEAIGGTITESELDPFWNGNKRFADLLTYVKSNCDCSA